jgi:hypothetical protein
MTQTPVARTEEELLAVEIGGAAVGENLRRAIEAGELIEHADGTLEVAHVESAQPWMYVHYGPSLGCDFLMRFAFRRAYAEGAVPSGCQACYKVKVVPRTLRELIAAWQIGKRTPCQSKWGVDLNNPHSQNVYAGYFYATGLDGARAIYRLVREAIDADPRLGPEITMTIKRGCSEYEAALGPSDQYTFSPELAEVEAYLRTRFRKSAPAKTTGAPMAYWIDMAFRMGDDTYLDCTGGKRLRPKTLTYEP